MDRSASAQGIALDPQQLLLEVEHYKSQLHAVNQTIELNNDIKHDCINFKNQVEDGNDKRAQLQ